MAKYLVLYNAKEPAKEFMATSTPEEIQAGMAAWMKWKGTLPESSNFEFGMPVQATSHIADGIVSESDSKASGYSILEADNKDAVVEMLKGHPHLQRPGASIDVLEMLSMPGM